MDLVGLGLVVLFYSLVLALGVYAARLNKADKDDVGNDDAGGLLLAGRGLGFAAGLATLVATQVGGAFVNGTAEEVYKQGILWCLAPIGYSLSITVNAFFFADRLREKRCVTLVDVLQEAYGDRLGSILYLPSCLGDICWTTAVLSALAGTLQVFLGVDRTATVLVSAAVAISYTVLGGLRAVTYTDVIQVVFIFVGLWSALPFVINAVNLSDATDITVWTGKVSGHSLVTYLDTLAYILLGGIPWQPYYQRVLALQSPTEVRKLSVAATLLCLSCVVPPAILGVSAKKAFSPEEVEDPSLVLPLVVVENTPYAVAMLCLAAVRSACSELKSDSFEDLLHNDAKLDSQLYDEGPDTEARDDLVEASSGLPGDVDDESSDVRKTDTGDVLRPKDCDELQKKTVKSRDDGTSSKKRTDTFRVPKLKEAPRDDDDRATTAKEDKTNPEGAGKETSQAGPKYRLGLPKRQKQPKISETFKSDDTAEEVGTLSPLRCSSRNRVPTVRFASPERKSLRTKDKRKKIVSDNFDLDTDDEEKIAAVNFQRAQEAKRTFGKHVWDTLENAKSRDDAENNKSLGEKDYEDIVSEHLEKSRRDDADRKQVEQVEADDEDVSANVAKKISPKKGSGPGAKKRSKCDHDDDFGEEWSTTSKNNTREKKQTQQQKKKKKKNDQNKTSGKRGLFSTAIQMSDDPAPDGSRAERKVTAKTDEKVSKKVVKKFVFPTSADICHDSSEDDKCQEELISPKKVKASDAFDVDEMLETELKALKKTKNPKDVSKLIRRQVEVIKRVQRRTSKTPVKRSNRRLPKNSSEEFVSPGTPKGKGKKKIAPAKDQRLMTSFLKKDGEKTGEASGDDASMTVDQSNELLDEEIMDYLPTIDEVAASQDLVATTKTVEEYLEKLKAMKLQQEEEDREEHERDEERLQKELQRKEFQAENSRMQTRLLEELDESRTRSLVRRNFSYLQKILDGNEEVESERARLYARGGQAREALLYTMITHPYSDNQLEWVVDELQSKCMPNEDDRVEASKFLWRVLLAEALIKLYMDHFSIASKKEAERRIRETPLQDDLLSRS